MKITYRKTKTGHYVVYGPAASIKAGSVVTVTKKNGMTKQEHVESIGKPFTVDGVQMVYGYLTASSPHHPYRTGGRECDNCGGPGARFHRFDSSGLAGTVCAACNYEDDYNLSFA